MSGTANRQTILTLQGGGALGAYQAGAFQALAEADEHPDWIAGVSIGAVNGAIIAGNAPEKRVERLRDFWDVVTEPSAAWPDFPNQTWQAAIRQASAAAAVLFGQPGFFRPRPPLDWLGPHMPVSFYETAGLRESLERLVDFDRINHKDAPRLSVGAVNVETGNLTYFDNRKQRIGPDQIMASGALPPGLAVVKIEGASYWDGGLVSNTPLQYVMSSDPKSDMLVFQIDLFPARGPLPSTIDQVFEREKDIRFSSRTRAGTDNACRTHRLRARVAALLELLPAEKASDPVVAEMRAFANPHRVDIVHLIYRPDVPQGSAKDYEFARAVMDERWQAGLTDARRTLNAAPWRAAPAPGEAVRVFDVPGAALP
jgi:NTE family protein